jgi:hypothetical protein
VLAHRHRLIAAVLSNSKAIADEIHAEVDVRARTAGDLD